MTDPDGRAQAGITLANEQSSLEVDDDALLSLLRSAADVAGWRGTLSFVLVDDEQMRVLHRDFMDIDEPTDVLSFPLDENVGEVVVSTDTARANALRLGAAAETEMLLYAVHGMLHLLGFDDHDPADREAMQAEERRVLEALGHERPEWR